MSKREKKMRISEDDICCSNIRWYGLDKIGYVFSCITSGTFNIPEFACCNEEETIFLDRFFIFDFNKKTDVPNFQSIAHELNLKGITCFDTLIEDFDSGNEKEFKKHPYWYKKISQPNELLHFAQLPENIQKIMDSNRMDIDIQQDDYFFVPDNPNYLEPWQISFRENAQDELTKKLDELQGKGRKT